MKKQKSTYRLPISYPDVWLTLFLILTIPTGCTSKSESNSTTWGLRDIVVRKSIALGDHVETLEFLFEAPSSRDQYEFRLFFPGLGPVAYTDLAPIRTEVGRAWQGFTYELRDLRTNKIVSRYEVGDAESLNFNLNEPLSLWMDSDRHLRRGRKYQVRIQVPTTPDLEEAIRSAHFVIGIGDRVSL